MEFQHQSVLLHESLELLAIKPGDICVDATLGGGGHARYMAERTGPDGILIGIDQDQNALNAASDVLSEAPCQVVLEKGNFRHIERLIQEAGFPGADTILFDLGVSSPQLDWEERGFTYREDAPLDMRMDTDQPVTAAELLRTLSHRELTTILRDNADERWAARIAEFIVAYREKQPIETTGQLVEIIKAAIPAAARRDGPHPARRTFQALRIAVNEELEVLEEGLEAALRTLRPGGRLAVITFHSLEDRRVKDAFRNWAKDCHCPPEWPICQCGGAKSLAKILTRHPILPSPEELEVNPRARSAKLRGVLKHIKIDAEEE